jgi:hypothetical protein
VAEEKYIQLLSNESSKAQSWIFVSFALFGVVIYLGFLLKTTIHEMPVRLIPYAFETNKGAIEITSNGIDNQEYIALIARGDANLITEFTPKTSIRQMKKLLNRLDSSVYASSSADLLSQATENADNQLTQSYRVENIKPREGKEVLIFGHMKRWEGAKLISEGNIQFAITYRYSNGIPYIAKYKTFKDETKIITELNKAK